MYHRKVNTFIKRITHMDTKMNCSECGREMGLAEFLTYAEAYFLKLIIPTAIPFIISAINHKLSNETNNTRGVIDESMAGLANNFSIACPHCKQVDWYPASGEKPKKLESKSKDVVI